VAQQEHAPRTPAWESAIVARRYYLEGKQKNEIADELGVSRFKVARILDEALAQGIVRIEVALPEGLDVELGDALAEKYGIRRGIVALSQEGVPTVDVLGAAAARVLEARLTADDVLGISWGSTLTAVVDATRSLAAREIVQIVGGVASAGLEVNGVELLRRLARASGASVWPLHAPFLVGSAETARQLRDDPSLAPTIDRFSALTVALVGIGSLETGRSALWTELDGRAREELTKLGAVADLGGCILASDGSIVHDDALDRVIAIDADRLRAVGEVIAVAGGEGKSGAIAAALRSGLVDTLVTDSATARSLL
jgi:DNA-binding transcriptional regulator LsrR (DeoR family)